MEKGPEIDRDRLLIRRGERWKQTKKDCESQKAKCFSSCHGRQKTVMKREASDEDASPLAKAPAAINHAHSKRKFQ
jgi:hypothetical protein